MKKLYGRTQAKITQHSILEVNSNESGDGSYHSKTCGVCGKKYNAENTYFLDMDSDICSVDNKCSIQLHVVCNKCLNKILDTIRTKVDNIKLKRMIKKILQ